LDAVSYSQEVLLLHDASCLSEASSNSTVPRAQSFTISYFGFRFYTEYNIILICCLQRNVEANSSHKRRPY